MQCWKINVYKIELIQWNLFGKIIIHHHVYQLVEQVVDIYLHHHQLDLDVLRLTSRFTSVERETEPSLPPTYKSREPSVARRTSRDYSNDRWGQRRDSASTNDSYGDNDLKTSNRRRPDRWSAANSPNMNSSNYNFSSLPGRTYLHVMNMHDYTIEFACLLPFGMVELLLKVIQ